jgi:Fe-S-cluster containining protein
MPMTGKCLRCGQCCLYGGALQYDVFKYREILSYSFKNVNASERNKVSPCINLIYDIKTREAMCSDHRHRPTVCKQYPYRVEELIFNGCGFAII